MSIPIVVLVAGLVQALILSLAILQKKEKRKYPLLLLLGIIGVGLGLRIAYSPAFYLQWLKFVQFSDICLLLYGPAFWFFIRSVVQPVSKKEWKGLILHGIPALLFLVHFILFILPVSNRDFVVAEAAGSYDLYYSLLLGCGIILNAVYWWFTTRLVAKNYEGHTYSTRFIRLVLGINILAILGWLIGYTLSFFGPQWYDLFNAAYQLSFVALAASSIAISYYALSNSSFWMDNKKASKYAKSRLSQADIDDIGSRLEAYVNKDQKYLDPTLTLTQLSIGFKVNKVQLSQVINQYFNKGFADWINEKRIEEFIRKVESGNYHHLTLVGIAMESGFNTKATFNKAFKKAKGTTPTLFIGKRTATREAILIP